LNKDAVSLVTLLLLLSHGFSLGASGFTLL
jgi:hypothetical protein